MHCLICRYSLDCAPSFFAKEKQYNTYSEHEYKQCPRCDTCCLVSTTPLELGKYYPDNYYSFNLKLPAHSKISAINSFLLRAWLNQGSLANKLISKIKPFHSLEWLKGSSLTLDSKILDVGCGSALLLHQLESYGFSDLNGIDPFLKEIPLVTTKKIKIRRCNLDACKQESYDLIMFNHSLEHIPDPVRTLELASSMLTVSGLILIRIPLSDSWSFRKYKGNWYNLDAPRHLFIPSSGAISDLGASLGLALQKVVYDSNSSQFLSSEQYQLGMPISSAKKRLKRLDQFAFSLNQLGDGDRACFLFRHL